MGAELLDGKKRCMGDQVIRNHKSLNKQAERGGNTPQKGYKMNKERRKNLQSIIDSLEELKADLETLIEEEEEEYRDNIPENMQSGERYERAEEACNAMQYAVDAFDEVISNIESAIDA